MTTYKTDAVLKESGKYFNVYVLNTPVYFASVHKPKKKYQSETDYEYALTAFVDSETREKLEEFQLNKDLFEVGKDKNKKKQIKYKLSSQMKEDDKFSYDEVKGLHGLQLTCPAKTKSGDPRTVTVIDTDGEPFTEDLGNLTVCNVKLFAYKNQEDMLVVSIDTVQVVEHIPYEGGNGSGEVVDEIMGTYKRASAPAAPTPSTPSENSSQASTGASSTTSESDGDDPFADFDDDPGF